MLVTLLCPSNLNIWKDFDINPLDPKKCSFKNPFGDKEIFVFADVSHMLKLLRNNFIDSGFLLANGDHVSDAAVREMLSLAKTECSLTHKIRETFINVWGQQ